MIRSSSWTGSWCGRCPKDRDTTRASRCRRRIEPALPPGWYLRLEGSLRIPDYNEPEPDLCVVRGESDDYTDRHPGPGDVALVVEVADSSLSRDRGEKRDNYGRAGIPVYWIVNLVDRQLEVYSGPIGGVYPAPTILGEAESVELTIAGQVVGRIAVADLLPRPTEP